MWPLWKSRICSQREEGDSFLFLSCHFLASVGIKWQFRFSFFFSLRRRDGEVKEALAA